MNTVPRVVISGFASCIMLGTSIAAMCFGGLYACRLETNLSLSEVVMPAAIVFMIFIVIGVVIALLIHVLERFLVARGRHGLAWMAVGGGLIGLVPKLVWDFATGSFPENFYPHVDYIPFAAAGLVAAIVATQLKTIDLS